MSTDRASGKAESRKRPCRAVETHTFTRNNREEAQQPFIRSTDSWLTKTPLVPLNEAEGYRNHSASRRSAGLDQRTNRERSRIATPRQSTRIARPSRPFDTTTTWRTPHPRLYDVAISPRGRVIATCGANSVCLWSSAGTLLHEFARPGGAFACVKFSPDGSLLASGGFDGLLHIWELPRSRSARTIRHVALLGHDTVINDLDFHFSGLFLATGGFDQRVIIWNLQTGVAEMTLGNARAEITSVCFGDETLLATAADGTITRWTAGGSSCLTLPGGQLPLCIDHVDEETIWSTSTGHVAWKQEDSVRVMVPHQGAATAVRMRPTGWFASGGRDGVVRLYFRGRSMVTRTLDGPVGALDVRRNLIAAATEDGSLSIFGQQERTGLSKAEATSAGYQAE
jgi:WD40 repeat protein